MRRRIMKNFRFPAMFVTVFLLMFGSNHSASAGNFVRVSPDLLIHYEEAGTGVPIVFIPGWSSFTKYFDRQMAHFSDVQ